jgi:Inner membrane protein YgaP-like, transmembrane domain
VGRPGGRQTHRWPRRTASGWARRNAAPNRHGRAGDCPEKSAHGRILAGTDVWPIVRTLLPVRRLSPLPADALQAGIQPGGVPYVIPSCSPSPGARSRTGSPFHQCRGHGLGWRCTVRRNVGTLDRVVRAVAAAAAIGCAIAAPLPLSVRVLGFGGTGVYLAATALWRRCLCYSVVGRSTCGIDPASRAR